MLQYFTFTCPQCGSHDLCRVERTLAYRKERHIVRKGHEYLPGDSELMDLEYRGLAGLQCGRCRYPDDRKGSFRWKSWQDLEHSGCLASDPDEGKEKVSCMVCALDGHIYRTHVLLHPGEALSEDPRQRLLNHIIPGQTGIVISDWDKIEDMPDMPVGHSDVVK